MNNIPTIAVTLGEPAGVGPDLALRLAREKLDCRLVVIGDQNVLKERAQRLGTTVSVDQWHDRRNTSNQLLMIDERVSKPVVPGLLDVKNSNYVLRILDRAIKGCRSQEFDALVTGPVHKGVINDSGINFSGHTEYLAKHTGADLPVMMLAVDTIRVALVTTHVPLSAVPKLITTQRLQSTIDILLRDLENKFGIPQPRIAVCGLNPHAGEQGHLGREEIDVIAPVVCGYQERGHRVIGPLSADTVFVPDQMHQYDAVLSMYHDQALPVIKHLGFDRAVNVTLGLPIVRTSVDHGTALEIAGSDKVDTDNIVAAVNFASQMVRHQSRKGVPVQRHRPGKDIPH